MNKLIFLLISFLSNIYCFNQGLDDNRRFQLDSAISVMPKTLVKDFHKSHHYMDSIGKSDEEKAWLFYSYIASHFKYDLDRMNQSSKVSKEYTVEYTSFKTSGVCRDFAKLFAKLCANSNIPSFNVIGKSKTSIIQLRMKLKYLMQFSNHQWNVVRLNNEWYLVDPTWASIESEEKISYKDKKGIKRFVKIKHPNRNYFCANPHFFIKTHLPMHPAFYCSQKVPLFKKKYHKNWEKHLLYSDYDYNTFLDEMWNLKYPYLFKKLHQESNVYAQKAKKSSQLYRFLSNEVEELIGPKSPNYPLKFAEFKETLAKWDEIDKITQDSLGTSMFKYIKYKRKKELFKLWNKLEKQDIEEKKAAEKKAISKK